MKSLPPASKIRHTVTALALCALASSTGAQNTRLGHHAFCPRIDLSGSVLVEELHVGDDTGGLQFRPISGGLSIDWGAPGTLPRVWMTAYSDRIECNRRVDLEGGAEVGAFSTIHAPLEAGTPERLAQSVVSSGVK